MGRFFLKLKDVGFGGILSWIHKSMNYVLIGMVAILLLSLRVMQADNTKMAGDLQAAVSQVTEIAGVLEDYEKKLGEIDLAVTAVREHQLELRSETRAMYSFIDEVARDEDRSDDPFWGAYFDRLRNDASRPED